MNTLGIYFGDNDYGNTFYGVITMLLAAYKHNPESPVFEDDESLSEVVNALIIPCYRLYQEKYQHDNHEEIFEYLQRSESHIYRDDNVAVFCQTHDTDSQFIVVDIESGQVGFW
jgi:methenyltetrahydromethanopterin cyclohydrolase